jgi:hypothetical protein
MLLFSHFRKDAWLERSFYALSYQPQLSTVLLITRLLSRSLGEGWSLSQSLTVLDLTPLEPEGVVPAVI